MTWYISVITKMVLEKLKCSDQEAAQLREELEKYNFRLIRSTGENEMPLGAALYLLSHFKKRIDLETNPMEMLDIMRIFLIATITAIKIIEDTSCWNKDFILITFINSTLNPLQDIAENSEKSLDDREKMALLQINKWEMEYLKKLDFDLGLPPRDQLMAMIVTYAKQEDIAELRQRLNSTRYREADHFRRYFIERDILDLKKLFSIPDENVRILSIKGKITEIINNARGIKDLNDLFDCLNKNLAFVKNKSIYPSHSALWSDKVSGKSTLGYHVLTEIQARAYHFAEKELSGLTEKAIKTPGIQQKIRIYRKIFNASSTGQPNDYGKRFEEILRAVSPDNQTENNLKRKIGF